MSNDERAAPSPEYLFLGIRQLAELVADLVGTIQYMDDNRFTAEEHQKLAIVQIRLAGIRWGRWVAEET